MMNDGRESDSCVVPAKLANNAGRAAAELVEGRWLDKGNTDQQNALGTQGREARASSALDRVRQVAMRTRTRGSRRSFITSASIACAWPTGR
jgi:RNA-directed DNA polymerase